MTTPKSQKSNPNLKSLEQKISQIEQRNLEKDLNKSWETSWTRRFSIAVLTYVLIGSYMSFIGVNNPWLHAIIPTAGFILSTLTLAFLKQLWLIYIYHSNI